MQQARGQWSLHPHDRATCIHSRSHSRDGASVGSREQSPLRLAGLATGDSQGSQRVTETAGPGRRLGLASLFCLIWQIRGRKKEASRTQATPSTELGAPDCRGLGTPRLPADSGCLEARSVSQSCRAARETRGAGVTALALHVADPTQINAQHRRRTGAQTRSSLWAPTRAFLLTVGSESGLRFRLLRSSWGTADELLTLSHEPWLLHLKLRVQGEGTNDGNP